MNTEALLGETGHGSRDHRCCDRCPARNSGWDGVFSEIGGADQPQMTDRTVKNRARYLKQSVSASLDKYSRKCLAKHLAIYYNSLSAITRLGLGWDAVVSGTEGAPGQTGSALRASGVR